MTSATAVSAGRLPFDTSRSNPTAVNIPHLVGMRVDARCQSAPVCATVIVLLSFQAFCGFRSSFGSLPLRPTYLWVRNGVACTQPLDLHPLHPHPLYDLL